MIRCIQYLTTRVGEDKNKRRAVVGEVERVDKNKGIWNVRKEMIRTRGR